MNLVAYHEIYINWIPVVVPTEGLWAVYIVIAYKYNKEPRRHNEKGHPAPIDIKSS